MSLTIRKKRRNGRMANKRKSIGILDADLAFVILAAASMAVFDLWVFVAVTGR